MGSNPYATRLVIASFTALAALAQHGEPALRNLVARELPGYGELRFEVSSKSIAARKWANQGLRLVYAFNHPEAAASFRKATDLDPECAMCWWGLSFALGNNINAPLMPENAAPAYDAAQRAQSLATNSSAREAAYIGSLVRRYAKDNPGNRTALDKAYAEAMREVAQQFPDDLDAQTLAADALMNLTPWKLWSKDGKPNTYTLEIEDLLEGVLRRNPEHIGANHSYIHAVEASRNPERALPSAAVLSKLAPSSGHLVHMPAHIYMRTGNYEESAVLNRKAAALDKAYFDSIGAPTYYKPYWVHNLHFLSAAESMMGHYVGARDAIGAAAKQLEPLARILPSFESSLAMPLMLEVRFQQWDKILAMPPPASFSLSVNNIYLFATGMAQAAKNNSAAAAASLESFKTSVAALADERGFGLNSEKAVMAIAVAVLEAKIAYAKKDYPAAIASLQRAVAGEDALAYDEPADWYYPPSREALGAVLLTAGKLNQAEQVFRQELTNNRKSGRALFGLLESLKAQGKMEASAMVTPLYEQAWKKADRPLTIAQLF